MCLSNVKFALQQTVEGLAGIGYKKLAKEGDYICGTDYLGVIRPDISPSWMVAQGEFRSNPEYVRGFHLFLNPDDAKKYHYEGPSVIGEFLYKDVVAFGEQQVKKEHIPCIVAQQIKFVKLLLEPKNLITIKETKSGHKYLLHKKSTKLVSSLDGEARTIFGNEVLHDGHIVGKKTDVVYQDYLFEEIK